MLKKVIQRYAVAFGMAAAMFAAGAGGIQKANAAEIADQAGSVQESETVRQSETPQESEMQRRPETTQQSETTGQSETLPLKNVKKAPKLSGKWVKQHGKVRFLLQDKTYATKTWANIKGRYYYFDKNGFRRQGLFRYRNGKTYYLGKKGAMVTGWQKIRKHWYYFGKNGAMKKASWIRTKTGYAYVDAKGKRVVSSWVKVKGKKYYIDEKGVKVTKSRYIGNKAYYFDKKGVYHKDKKIKERLINPKGKMVALTFDDGPGPYTDRLLKCLKNNHNKRTKNVTGKITIKPKKGWKLKKIEVFNIFDGVKKVKNNSKVTLSIKGTGTGLYAYFKNAKTGVVQRLELGYGRGGFKTGENIYD